MDHFLDIPVPKLLQSRPRDERGYIITYVTFINPATKKPDFRIVDAIKVLRCIEERLCGICGTSLGKLCVFIGGPESVANRCFSDPPMHEECARYASKVCPYLANSKAKHHPFDHSAPEFKGQTIIENPIAGVVRPDKLALYFTRKFRRILIAHDKNSKPAPAIKTDKALKIEWF